MPVGANIKKRRFELRMSQQELADAMGYKTRSTIAKIESGENDVSQRKLQRFADVLDTTVEALIAGYASTPTVNAAAKSAPTRRNRSAVLILAGGKSGRNRQNIPSQFIDVHGKPILVHCMEVYQRHPAVDDIYVVCLKGWDGIVKAYADQFGITKLKGLIPAGSTGIASLKNGFDHIRDRYAPRDVIIIQESTRPMVRPETISTLLQACEEKGSATICHAMKDYVQFNLSGKKAQYVNRDTLVALQSPEAHRLSLLREVFDRVEQTHHPLMESCCAMLLYNLGYDINFIEGSTNNIKLVREEDLAAFAALVRE
ncbi:MAG: XRE family transcriptional regulator [Clostridia bacterium]|nr:XRE family transcriptional regulator [Clostridia bacterium]